MNDSIEITKMTLQSPRVLFSMSFVLFRVKNHYFFNYPLNWTFTYDLDLSCVSPETLTPFIDMILDPTLNPALAAGDPGRTLVTTLISTNI